MSFAMGRQLDDSTKSSPASSGTSVEQKSEYKDVSVYSGGTLILSRNAKLRVISDTCIELTSLAQEKYTIYNATVVVKEQNRHEKDNVAVSIPKENSQ